MRGLIVDLQGNPITSEDQKKRSEGELKEFMAKYHSRFQDWFAAYGPTTRPPIAYDINKGQWFWMGE